MKRHLLLVVAVAALISLLSLACGGGLSSLTGGGKGQAEQARALNASLSKAHQTVMGYFTELEGKVDTVGVIPEGVDTSKLDMGKVGEALLATFQAPVDKAAASKRAGLMLDGAAAKKAGTEATDGALAAPTEAQKELEASIADAGPEAQAFVKQQLALVAELRDGFSGILPAQVETLTKQAAEAQVKAEQYEKAALAASKLPTAGAKQKEDLTATQAEKGKTKDLSCKIVEDMKALPGRFGGASKQVVTRLSAMGKDVAAGDAPASAAPAAVEGGDAE